jgi:hypothetical protein
MSNKRIRVWAPEVVQQTTVELESSVVDLPSPKIEGCFTVQLLDAKTKDILKEHTFPNVITNAGMNAIATRTSVPTLLNSLQAGQGSTTPTGTDTGLSSPLAGVANSGDGFGETYGSASDAFGITYWFGRVNRLFTETQANGNITELGWWNRSDASGDFTVRTLVRDGSGTPISITKTSDNQLRVIYEYRVYPPSGSDVTGTLTIGTASFNYTIRPQNIFQERGWGTRPVEPFINGGVGYNLFQGDWQVRAEWTSDTWRTLVPATSTSFDRVKYDVFTSVTNESYVANSFQRDFNLVLDPSVGNTQIVMIAVSPWSSRGDTFDFNQEAVWQIFFNPPLSKSNTQRVSLRFRSTWARNRTSD